MHIAIHSIHLSDHNPGRSKTWLLSGHRVNKVNGLCPMCPTSMCQPQNKLAHHLCQSHRWCPHSNRGKSLGHPYSLICGIFWHTTPRRWPNMLWDECKWNVYINRWIKWRFFKIPYFIGNWLEIRFQKSSLTSHVRPINLREDMKIAITVNTHNSAFGSTLANQS